jgi:hypothetical protein
MIEGIKQHAALVQLAETIEAHGKEPLENVAAFSMLRGAAVLLDETLNLLEPGDDPLLAGRPARVLLRLDLDTEFFEQRVIVIGELRAASTFMRARNATPSAMRFSQASGDVIEGSRPRSCLNLKARLARSRASSIVRLTRLPAITAATCFRLSSLMVLARMA